METEVRMEKKIKSKTYDNIEKDIKELLEGESKLSTYKYSSVQQDNEIKTKHN